MFQPNDRISITLAAGEWNAVLSLLAEGPYRITAGLIAAIQKQVAAQDPGDSPDAGAPGPGPEAPAPVAQPNGPLLAKT